MYMQTLPCDTCGEISHYYVRYMWKDHLLYCVRYFQIGHCSASETCRKISYCTIDVKGTCKSGAALCQIVWKHSHLNVWEYDT